MNIKDLEEELALEKLRNEALLPILKAAMKLTLGHQYDLRTKHNATLVPTADYEALRTTTEAYVGLAMEEAIA